MSDYKDGDVIKGIVEVLSEKPAGRGKVYNIKMDSGEWFGCGFDKPAFKQGDCIEFEVVLNERNGTVYTNLNHDKCKVVQADAAPAYTKNEKGISPVDLRTALHAARSGALETVAALMSAEIIKPPSKGSDKQPWFDQQIGDYTAFYYEQSLAVMKGENPFAETVADTPEDNF
jgi:hypothetical protein